MCAWLVSLSVMSSGVSAWQQVAASFPSGCMMGHCVCGPHCIPSVHRWTRGSPPHFSCCDRGSADGSRGPCFGSSWVCTWKWGSRALVLFLRRLRGRGSRWWALPAALAAPAAVTVPSGGCEGLINHTAAVRGRPGRVRNVRTAISMLRYKMLHFHVFTEVAPLPSHSP